MDCYADLILGYNWLCTHNLASLYDLNEVCLCAENGSTSGRRIRLDLVLDAPTSSATRLSPAEAHALLGAVGLGDVPTLRRPSLWRPLEGRSSAVATLAAAAAAAWAEDTLAGLADNGTTLADGTELLVFHVAFAADWPAFTLTPDDGDPPDLPHWPVSMPTCLRARHRSCPPIVAPGSSCGSRPLPTNAAALAAD